MIPSDLLKRVFLELRDQLDAEELIMGREVAEEWDPEAAVEKRTPHTDRILRANLRRAT